MVLALLAFVGLVVLFRWLLQPVVVKPPTEEAAEPTTEAPTTDK